MAHKIIQGKVVVDWTTGDPEGDRLVLLAAYRDFIKELLHEVRGWHHDGGEDAHEAIAKVVDKWQVSIDDQVDEVPRIWIKRPEQ